MRIAHRLGSLLAAGLLTLSGCGGVSTPEAPPSRAPTGFTNPVYPNNFDGTAHVVRPTVNYPTRP